MYTQGSKSVRLMTFQILTAFLVSGASIPTTISSTHIISKSAAAVNNTSNPSLTAKPSCMVDPTGRYIDISIRACQPALNQLMQQPDPSTPIEYHWSGHPIRLTGAPCIVSLEYAGPSSNIAISAKGIVGDAYWIIALCELAGVGWMHIDGSKGWLVTVMGAAEGNGIVNATIGETRNTSLLGDQGERYTELTESS